MELYKQILETDYSEYRSGPLKFGICMASYYRHNGKSGHYLRRSLQSVVQQTATNWHIYLVGDKYEENYEFELIANTVPKEKITFVNLSIAPERQNLTGMNLWRVGGSHAFNIANTLALKDGCDYILHLDDDDAWSPKKIQLLNYATQHITPKFIFHYSTHTDPVRLPREVINEIYINNLIPKPSNCIHSSYCVHKSLMLDFRYSGYEPNKMTYIAGDIQFLNYLKEFFRKNGDSSLFLPFLLSFHETEQEAISLLPKPEYKILSYLEQQTPHSSRLVKLLADSMCGKTFHHHYHILFSLRDLIPKEEAVYTEIGTFNGGSLCLMLQHPKNTQLVSIDPFHLERTNIDIVQRNIGIYNIFNRHVSLTKQFSNNTAFLQELKDTQFQTDILFIDGDHRFKAVIEDFHNFKNFVNPGGFIVFDDYQDTQYSPEVKPAVDTIMQDIITHKLPFRIVGNPFNFFSVYPKECKFLNEFIIQRL